MDTLPEGVTLVSLHDPASLHATIAGAVGDTLEPDDQVRLIRQGRATVEGAEFRKTALLEAREYASRTHSPVATCHAVTGIAPTPPTSPIPRCVGQPLPVSSQGAV